MAKEKTPAPYHYLLQSAAWRFYFDDGQQEEAIEIVEKIFPECDEKPGSPLWLLLKNHSLESFIHQNHFARAHELLNELTSWKEALPWQHPGPYDYLNALLLHREKKIHEALQILEACPPNRIAGCEAHVFKLKMDLLTRAERFEEAEEELRYALPRVKSTSIASLNISRFISKFDYLHTSSVLALARRDYSRARSLTLESLEEVKPFSWRLERNIQDFLISIDLASRHTRAARLMLQTLFPEAKAKKPVMWARLHLQEGQLEKAVEPFRTLFLNQSSDRIREHFRFSHDLQLPIFTELMSEVVKSIPNKISKKISKETVEPESPESSTQTPFVGDSPSIRKIRDSLPKFASSNMPLLVSGETGCGKDVVARLIHELSSRSREPFIAVNCGSLTDALIESELFGHVKGSFTGAAADREGLFLAAGKGTIFLDEISSTSPHLQASLLRVLENQEIRPVGSNKSIPIRCRVLAATNVPLEKATQDGKFRQDLYFRLARLHIHITPLRERKEDIAVLARFYFKKYCAGIQMIIGDDLLEVMTQYPWPGNVRELRNEVERILFNAGDTHRLTASLFTLGNNQLYSMRDPIISEPTPPLVSRVQPISPPQISFENKHLQTKVNYRTMRRERLLQFLQTKPRVTQAEIIYELQLSPCTAIADLKNLEDEGKIRRISAPTSGKTLYFEFLGV